MKQSYSSNTKSRESNVHKSVDETIENFLVELSEFHNTISLFAIKNSDNELEVAINRISNAKTALNKRNRARHDSGEYGKEK